ncbi:MAG: hypothetical protein CHACPFDD_00687 [Phycisphaerae bacterium]|nr:hypothetical protein [Phycisphaerae bacterium]
MRAADKQTTGQSHARRAAWLLAIAAGGALFAFAAAARDPDLPPSQSDVSREPMTLGLRGSKHDFSDSAREPRDLCLPCHTPHITASQAPLIVRRAATTQPLRPYQTGIGGLDESSLLCLGCHDGVAAPDVYAGAHGLRWSDRTGAPGGLGRRRLTSHPVGIEYPAADAKYHPAAVVTGTAGLKLPHGRIQCTTCHDPHNTRRNAGMLVISNDGSRLCLSCHRL